MPPSAVVSSQEEVPASDPGEAHHLLRPCGVFTTEAEAQSPWGGSSPHTRFGCLGGMLIFPYKPSSFQIKANTAQLEGRPVSGAADRAAGPTLL